MQIRRQLLVQIISIVYESAVPLKLAAVQQQLIDPNVEAGLAYMEDHLGRHRWFAGEHLSMADFQMSFAVEAALSRGAKAAERPHLQAYCARMQARPAYQRAIQKGGPVVMAM